MLVAMLVHHRMREAVLARHGTPAHAAGERAGDLVETRVAADRAAGA
jgi:hypothetical protein